MMAEKQYIEREVAVEILKEKSLKMFNAYYKGYVNAIRDLIDIPSADVQEVKRGYWIPERDPDENNRIQCFHCSVCDDDFHDIGAFVATKYCPNCGARMDGGENG